MSRLGDRLGESAHLAGRLSRLLPQVCEEGFRPTGGRDDTGPVSGSKDRRRPPPTGALHAARAYREASARVARADLSLCRGLPGRYRAAPVSRPVADRRQTASAREAFLLSTRVAWGLRVGRGRVPHLGPRLRGHLADASDEVVRAHRLVTPHLPPEPQPKPCKRRGCSAAAQTKAANGRCEEHRWCVECGENEGLSARTVCRRCEQRQTTARRKAA